MTAPRQTQCVYVLSAADAPGLLIQVRVRGDSKFDGQPASPLSCAMRGISQASVSCFL